MALLFECHSRAEDIMKNPAISDWASLSKLMMFD